MPSSTSPLESKFSASVNGKDCNEDLEVARCEVLAEGTPGPTAAHPTERPKRPLSAYNLFFRDQRELLLRALPSSNKGRGHGKIGFRDLAKVIGARWKAIGLVEKELYEKTASQLRANYMEQLNKWKAIQEKNGKPTKRKKRKNGCGVKRKEPSTSHANKPVYFNTASACPGAGSAHLVRSSYMAPSYNAVEENNTFHMVPRPIDTSLSAHLAMTHQGHVPPRKVAFPMTGKDSFYPQSYVPRHEHYNVVDEAPEPFEAFSGPEWEPLPVGSEQILFDEDSKRTGYKADTDCLNLFVNTFGQHQM